MATPSNHEQVISKFAALLGTKGTQKEFLPAKPPSSDLGTVNSRELLLCLSKALESHEVACTIPSLDMRKIDEDAGINPLPNVGEHRSIIHLQPAGSKSGVPRMDASVLGVSNAADASAKAAEVEQKAAQTLGSLTSWTKSSVAYAPAALAKNIADSFSSLVNSRVQAWTILLLRHSLTTGDSASRSRLLTMLSSIINVVSANTSFKTLALPKSAMGHAKEADVILPLLLEVDLQVSIQSKNDTVTLRAPGTISGNFDNNGNGLGLVKVDIRFDTGVMLDSMVQQARMVVFKAVAKATSSNESLPLDSQIDLSPPTDPSVAPTLSGFSSALNISAGTSETAQKAVNRLQLQKSRASALKLNSVLQNDSGKLNANAHFDRMKKAKSVQWDSEMDVQKPKISQQNPSPKRQRLNTEARLRSFKSFGRAHAGDFGSGSGPRNATFGDFGRKPIWGRNGKLANHPSPMQPNYDQSQDLLAPPSSSNTKNATFILQKPALHLASPAGLETKTKSDPRQGHSSIPRSATAHENWLVKNTFGNAL
eukprot:scaffold3450_cov114-Cylindrotheca_fusiformis.AAC.22